METRDTRDIIGQLEAAIEAGRIDDAIAVLSAMRLPDRAEAFAVLDDEDQATLIPQMELSEAADLLEEMDDEDAVTVASTLSSEMLADVLDEMDPDEAADILGDLSAQQASDALAAMEEADEVIPLLRHGDETAGGLMTTAFVGLRPRTTVAQAIEFLRSTDVEELGTYYLYVVDRDQHLVGVVGLRDLVRAQPSTLIGAITNRDVIRVEAGVDQEEAARLMARYDLAALPVVNEEGVLQGVITHDDIIDVIEEETTEDVLHLAGIESGPIGDKPYWSQRLIEVVRSRFTWLLVLFAAQTLTGTVLQHFESELQAVVELTFFIPLLIGTGGNAGAQTVTTVIRALALKEVERRDILRVLRREMVSGAFLGLLLAAVAFGRVALWGVGLELAAVVSITVFAVCLWANTVGSLIPMLADAAGIDPTVMSAPLISTLVDATGLLIYLSVAVMVLEQI
ncbi:MAG: magnesium transporter [Anaerolineae bacterium]|nr:magnesium transporter [Anaerolineae bacterium]